MKKLLLTSAMASMVMFSTASQSKAILFTDLDIVAQELSATGPQSSYNGTFNIVDDGFIPGTHSVWAAGITFLLIDDLDPDGENFTINLDGALSTSQYTSFLVLNGTPVGINLLASLNSEGILSYNVTSTSGDFWLMSALLFAEASEQSPETQPVPDNGSTLILAAFALIGLAFVEWRILKRA